MARVLSCILFLMLFSRAAHAQQDTLAYSAGTPAWVGQFTTLSANAVIGGLTAGLIQELRGGSFQDGFVRGALGGTAIYAGKRVAIERFSGAGLIGREVAAVGASIVRNASDGIGTFDRLILPVGVTRLYWQPKQKKASLKLDIVAAGYVVYGVLEKELDFEVEQSLSAGAAVFSTNEKLISYGTGEQHAAGVSRAGIVLRAHITPYGDEFLDRAFAHERVHVLQDDQLFITLNDHADDWVLGRLGPAARISRFVDINLSTEVLRILGGFIDNHADRPWEMEAIFLTRE